MEDNFDKEMDTLLREAAQSGRVVSTDDFDSHLDADEISMFAENALPEKARARTMKHLAECNNCRNILSNLILLNEETEDESVSTVIEERTVQTAAVPWYKKLFVFPQIAYAMGALALVFSGAIGFLVYQTANQSGSFEMAKSEPSAMNTNASGPNAGESDDQFDEGLSNTMTANNNAGTIANSDVKPSANANISAPDAPTAKLPADEKSGQTKLKTEENNRAENRPESVSKPTPDNKDKEFSVDGASGDDSVMRDASPPPPASAPPPKPVTSRSKSEPKKKADKSSAESDQTKLAGNAETRRQISGKTFNRVNGVWIDSDYRQMANMQMPMTITVRRGSSQYKNLDKNIRIIAESLEGQVIVVSNNKAYRIQ